MTEFSGCPGSRMMDFSKDKDKDKDKAEQDAPSGNIASQLQQWPIQLHLIHPMAPYYEKADVLLTADCVAYAMGSFHQDYLKGKSIAIACPKLDEGQDIYVEKVKAWFDEAKINTLTVLIMQVPCCMGLVEVVRKAAQQAERKVPVKMVVVGLQGDILKEDWMSA